MSALCGERFEACVCSKLRGHEGPHLCVLATYGAVCGGSWYERSEEGIVRFPSLASIRAGMKASGWEDEEIEGVIAAARAGIPADKLVEEYVE